MKAILQVAWVETWKQSGHFFEFLGKEWRELAYAPPVFPQRILKSSFLFQKGIISSATQKAWMCWVKIP